MATEWTDPFLWIRVAEVLLAFGFVIFVHELGHFAVAKLCGVKCEKFYLGFDIGGWKICKFRRGETEYGIGIVPLGGYVKMLGQEDNPAKLREEIEKARLEHADDQPAKPGSAAAETDRLGDEEIDAAEQALFDPRSFLAQSVPRRMAIISAGVVMNLIFAFVLASIAFALGVERVQCVVGQTIPGGAAWQEGLRVGDRIVKVADRDIEKFRDMQHAVSLGNDLDEGLPIEVSRPGVARTLEFRVVPDSSGKIPMIGILSSRTNVVWGEPLVAMPGTPAADCSPGFMTGDKIVEIDGRPISSYPELHACLALHPEQPLAVVVERTVETDRGDSPRRERVTIDVAPNPMRRLGLVMQMGPISAVQQGSPASAAGIRPGDKIVAIDGQPAGDPLTLPDRLRRRAGETITIAVQRKGDPVDLQATLRETDWYEFPIGGGSPLDLPVSIPSLGIAYPVLNQVESVVEGSPADKAGLRPGDTIVAATLKPPKDQTPQERQAEQRKLRLKFDAKNRNWPSLINALQELLPGTEVELQWLREEEQEEPMTARLPSEPSADWFNPDRGLLLGQLVFCEQAHSFGEAVQLGASETVYSTLLVYRILQKLGTQQVSAKALGGPISIFAWLKHAAEQSFSELLITLTLLSANLAVLNFLPIPLLDGGHMLFLAWEGVRGRPASERIQLALTYVGLVIVLSLMIWVIGLDIVWLISRFF